MSDDTHRQDPDDEDREEEPPEDEVDPDAPELAELPPREESDSVVPDLVEVVVLSTRPDVDEDEGKEVDEYEARRLSVASWRPLTCSISTTPKSRHRPILPPLEPSPL